MGLISRVSSRTYRESLLIAHKMLFRRGSALVSRINGLRRLHNLPKEPIQGDYQVWVGYLRKPPPATTGYDIPNWAPYAGWLAIAVFMWIWAPDQSCETDSCAVKPSASTFTHSSRSVSTRPSRSDATLCKSSSMPTTRTMTEKTRTTNKLIHNIQLLSLLSW